MNNAARAQKAYRAIVHYESESSVEECISALLGDLRHLCDEHGYDFAERDGVGHRNYLTELGEERRDKRPHVEVKIDTTVADNDGDVALALIGVAHEITEGRTSGSATLRGDTAATFSTHYA